MDALARRMSSAQLRGWMEFWELEPWGAWRDNWHSAILATLLANANRGNRPAFQMDQFFYRDARTEQERNDAAMLATLHAIAVKKPPEAQRG